SEAGRSSTSPTIAPASCHPLLTAESARSPRSRKPSGGGTTLNSLASRAITVFSARPCEGVRVRATRRPPAPVREERREGSRPARPIARVGSKLLDFDRSGGSNDRSPTAPPRRAGTVPGVAPDRATGHHA